MQGGRGADSAVRSALGVVGGDLGSPVAVCVRYRVRRLDRADIRERTDLAGWEASTRRGEGTPPLRLGCRSCLPTPC